MGMERGTTIILVPTDSALIRQYRFTSLKKCKLNFTYRGKFPCEKGANIPRIFDSNSIKANQTGMERETAMVLVSADSALTREGKCTAYGNLGTV